MKTSFLLRGAFIFSIALLLFSSCGKKEEQKLQTFSPEAFAYSLSDGWDVNASIRVKGFKAEKDKETFIAKLSFSVDLITPEGKILDSVAKDTLEEESGEEFSDLPVETQFTLDSTYLPGKYKVKFKIKDEHSGQTVTAEKEFEIVK